VCSSDLARLGIPLVEVPIAPTVAESEAQIRHLGQRAF
jgi:Glu-tRNA(Gln) amidotransferase subunit E-like FAD-binding protein